MALKHSRQRSQAIVEFGIIALLFTLLMFAVVDFGLLLNGWLTVASDAQQLARDAAVGTYSNDTPGAPIGADQLQMEARTLGIAGVTADNPPFTGGYCCGSNSALIVNVTYYNQCTPGVGVCNPVLANELDNHYAGGTCASSCQHPARPGRTTFCTPNPPTTLCPGDTVVVTLTAAGAQVITPLVRPFFRNPVSCPDPSAAHCYVRLSSTVAMRFEGSQF